MQVSLKAATSGSFAVTVPVGALTTGPGGSSTQAGLATLTVATPSGGGGGGGALQSGELVAGAAGLLALWHRRRRRQAWA